MKITASPNQRRLWVEWKLNPMDISYNLSMVFDIKGKVPIEKVRYAFHMLILRYPALQAKFSGEGNDLYLDCTDELMDIKTVNVNGICNIDLLRLTENFIYEPYNLEKGNLFKAKLFIVNETTSRLVFALHHIISDIETLNCIRRTFEEGFNSDKGAIDNEKVFLLKPTDFFCKEDAINFYRHALKDKSLKYELPKGGEAQVIRFTLGKNLFTKVLDFCRKNNFTTFQFLSGVFSVFLCFYFRNTNICFSYPVSTRKKNAELIGVFSVNTQLMPLKLDNEMSFHSVLLKVKEIREKTRDFELPYEELISSLRQLEVIKSHDTSNIALAESDLRLKGLDLIGLDVTPVYIENTYSGYDILLQYQQTDTLNFCLHLNCICFDTTYHSGIKNDFIRLIDYLIENPCLSIKNMYMDLLKENILFNTEYAFDDKKGSLIYNEFTKIVSKYNNEIAVLSDDYSIKYQELLCRADKMAVYLESVLTEDIVGLFFSQSISLIVVILALFKLKKAYVPLNPVLPSSYLAEIISDSKIKVILTDKSRINLDNVTEIDWFIINENMLDKSMDKNSIKNESNSNLAYILYTSGTTGRAKGVRISQNNIVSLIKSCRKIYDISCADVIPWFHSYSFDFSVWELWSSLLNGAKLLVLSEKSKVSPEEFTKDIKKFRVTVLNQTPSALRRWMIYLSNKKDQEPCLNTLRLLITGGEALYPEHVASILRKEHSFCCQIYNMYGITEDTVHSTFFKVTESYLNLKASIIGRPIPGKKIIIVDNNFLPLPIGCIGRLLVAGHGVSSGYNMAEDLTSKRFIVLENFQEKWLYTGDLARILSGGEIEYIGREDTVLKLKGYRISLSEIESILAELPEVRSVKVLVKYNANIPDCLIAFIILHDERTLEEVKTKAKLVMPAYMLPRELISVKEFPLTSNLKLDIKALYDIKCSKVNKEQVSDNKTISHVESVWVKVLKNEIASKKINFFDAGGDSISLIVLHAEIERHFSISMPVLTLMICSTIESQAKAIDKILLDANKQKIGNQNEY